MDRNVSRAFEDDFFFIVTGRGVPRILQGGMHIFG
jgi:hypothetical protein